MRWTLLGRGLRRKVLAGARRQILSSSPGSKVPGFHPSLGTRMDAEKLSSPLGAGTPAVFCRVASGGTPSHQTACPCARPQSGAPGRRDAHRAPPRSSRPILRPPPPPPTLSAPKTGHSPQHLSKSHRSRAPTGTRRRLNHDARLIRCAPPPRTGGSARP